MMLYINISVLLGSYNLGRKLNNIVLFCLVVLKEEF